MTPRDAVAKIKDNAVRFDMTGEQAAFVVASIKRCCLCGKRLSFYQPYGLIGYPRLMDECVRYAAFCGPCFEASNAALKRAWRRILQKKVKP